jgi:hypothetical protein
MLKWKLWIMVIANVVSVPDCLANEISDLIFLRILYLNDYERRIC